MLPHPCTCPCCGRSLHTSVRWTRLVTEEPTVVECSGPWGIDDSVAVGGDVLVTVRCPTCCTETNVGRDFPLAAA